MADEIDPADNIARLLAHLKDDSLAAQLVRVYRDAKGDDPGESLKAILAGRLKQLKAGFDADAD